MAGYGVCEVKAYTAERRPIVEYRSATLGTWVTIDGDYRTFSNVKEAKEYAEKKTKERLAQL